MESTADVDEEGHPHTGSVHHVIQFIHPQGPVGGHGILKEGDEILEINGHILVGLQHQEAIDVVKQTSNFVQVVVCHVVSENLKEHDEEKIETHSAGGLDSSLVCVVCVGGGVVLCVYRWTREGGCVG